MRYADGIIRFISLWLTFIVLVVVFPLPLLLLKVIDGTVSDVSIKTRAISCRIWLKRLAGYLVLVVLGVFVYIEEEEARGDDDDADESITSLLEKNRSIVTFSHASSLDAFIITAAVPVRSYSIGIIIVIIIILTILIIIILIILIIIIISEK